MAQQVITQYGASLGSLAKAFPTVANGTIVSNGVISTDPAVQQAFATQLQIAINVVNFQLASNLAVFNGCQPGPRDHSFSKPSLVAASLVPGPPAPGYRHRDHRHRDYRHGITGTGTPAREPLALDTGTGTRTSAPEPERHP